MIRIFVFVIRIRLFTIVLKKHNILLACVYKQFLLHKYFSIFHRLKANKKFYKKLINKRKKYSVLFDQDDKRFYFVNVK